MQNLKRTITFFVILNSLFVLMNALEFFWQQHLFRFRGDYHSSIELQYFSLFMRREENVHFWLNLLAYLILFLLLFFCNRFIKKQNLGKGYHVLLVILGFLPIANWFLLYIIWRKSNRILFEYAGMNYKRSDQFIIIIWVLTLVAAISPLIVPIFTMYSRSPESVSEVMYYSGFASIIRSLYLIIMSFLFLFYSLSFKRAINNVKDPVKIITESQLLDD